MSTKPWALVTGASAGIGRAIATELARRGWNLAITARRADRLDALAADLARDHGAEVAVIAGDLADAAFRADLFAAATSGRSLRMVVNNAGFGWQGPFVANGLHAHQAMIDLNVSALVDLSWRAARHIQDHGEPGHILNVASIGAWQPVPSFALYAATKALVRSFSVALALELAGTNVKVTCANPGGTRTEFMDVAGMKLDDWRAGTMQSAEEVAEEALDAALDGAPDVVTGWMNKLMTFGTRFVPATAAARLAEKSMAPHP